MRVTMEGATALVTGAGAGIGRAIAMEFGRLGAQVAVADRDPQKCEALVADFEREGIDSLVSATDVTDAAGVATLVHSIDRRYGRLDVLVNNVGHHLGIWKPVADSTDEEWEALYNVNLRHMFVVTRAAVPLMRRAGTGGSIINLSSIEGFRGCPFSVAYTTFKHAVTGFTRALALELAGDGIRVNLIAPETTDSEQCPLEEALRPETRAQADRTIPLGRFGQPEDHAGAAVFLATSMSAWITGTSIHIDGGALAAGAFQRTPEGDWTNMPLVAGKASF